VGDIVLEVTNTFSGLGEVNSAAHEFTITTPGPYVATLIDNEIFAPFSVLGMGITKTGGETLGTLAAPGSFTFDASVAGSYTALVGGIVGSGGILPVGTYGLSVTLVPEPETWAMMLVGMGLVGWQLRRKVKSSAASKFV
jgi:hypothetical protein